MKPKEKAEQLVELFIEHSDGVPDDYDWMDPVSHSDKKQFMSAKQCALISVDQMIDMLPFTDIMTGIGRWCEMKRQYLYEVKEEIQKL